MQEARPDVPGAAWCLALVGPTASGKSAAAMAIAREHPVEIISVDSAQVYRGMDIGTAKPAAEERAMVAHHLIDILDPRDAYSAAGFVRDAQRLVREINGRGRLALLVGGTMLYFKALLQGLHDMPGANPAVRLMLDREAAERGWPALHAELARVDPQTAQRLQPRDTQRIQRALEVYRVSGRALSSYHNAAKPAAEARAFAGMALISLEPRHRAWLHERIAQRFDAMLAAGFLEEVRALRQRADLSPELASMRCVGYRQAWEALDGRWPMRELREKGISATRQLAKRQLTWLRAMPQRHTLACDEPGLEPRLLAMTDLLARTRT